MDEGASNISQKVSFTVSEIILNFKEHDPFSFDFTDNDFPCDPDQLFSSFDSYSIDESTKEKESIFEPISANQFLLNIDPSTPQTIPSSAYLVQNIANNWQHSIIQDPSIRNSQNYCYASLSFLNPPEPVYHVRYLSEISNILLVVDENLEKKTPSPKKYLSGRYIKGLRGRYITIRLPIIVSHNSNLFIRVTRLTLPYEDISFIHPYPLLCSFAKTQMQSEIIIEGSSIYFKISGEEIRSRSKHFPNMILTRLKQCHLKQINHLYAFDSNHRVYPFIGKTSKQKIALYQLKKSRLDFRLVIRCEETGAFLTTNIFCCSNALLEEEGIECKKASK